MPFTPFHMGPGLLIKSVLQGAFSLMVFGWTQILMDLQPLFVMLRGRGHVHGFTHTFVGATLIGLAGAVSGKYLGQVGLAILGGFAPSRDRPAADQGARWSEAAIGWPAALASGYIGSYSHVLLDAIMHRDLQPWAPWSLDNPFLGAISLQTLHLGCAASAALGSILYMTIAARRQEGRRRDPREDIFDEKAEGQ